MMIDLRINQYKYKDNKIKNINSMNNYMKKIIKLNLKSIKIKNSLNLKKEQINLITNRKHFNLIKKKKYNKDKA